MKKVAQTIGIDVSKLTLDAYAMTVEKHEQFTNDYKGFKQLVDWAVEKKDGRGQILFCFEHTGWYCLMLSWFLYENHYPYCCVNALEIKRSMGLRRGKSDKADAMEIAGYAWLRRDELIPSVPPSKYLIELQRLMALREQLVKHHTANANLYKGMLNIVTNSNQDTAMTILASEMQEIQKYIQGTEKAMKTLINEDQQMKHNYKLSKTVKGVGMVLAIQLLLHTHNYTRFESCRQFSAYCGLVPYPYQSGTSINGRNRIHPICDKKMKSLLTTSSVSAIQHDSELKKYYLKRIEEGKPKMSVINIIRNKIVSRVFATVRRGTPYVEIK